MSYWSFEKTRAIHNIANGSLLCGIFGGCLMLFLEESCRKGWHHEDPEHEDLQ